MANTDDLIQRLEAIESELADLAMDKLRVSITDNDPAAAAEEKLITRARRSVEKAAGLLAGMPSSVDD